VVIGFRLCVARRPTALEIKQILSLYEKELDRYRNDPRAARLVAAGTAVSDATVSGATEGELAAWTIVSNVLLCMDETQTRE